MLLLLTSIVLIFSVHRSLLHRDIVLVCLMLGLIASTVIPIVPVVLVVATLISARVERLIPDIQSVERVPSERLPIRKIALILFLIVFKIGPSRF